MSDINSQIENSIIEIRKRNGSISNFDKDKISNAIFKALEATNKPDKELATELTSGVLNRLIEHGFSAEYAPSVEDIQDLVESTPVSYTHLTLPTISSV